MKFNTSNVNLNKKEMEIKYGQETLFQFLFPFKIDFNNVYCNPLRADKNASCKFVVMGRTLIFKDWSKSVNYSWAEFGMQYLNMTLPELLIHCNSNLKVESKQSTLSIKSYNKKITKIDIKSKDFTELELQDFIFNGYVCTQQLLNNAGIYSVKTLYYNNECIMENCNNIYAFLNINFEGEYNYQIYFPNNNKDKRYRAVTTTLIPQLDKIDYNKDYIIITKSNMDAFILKYILEFNTIAILNENVLISKEYMYMLDDKFNIILLFDNDEAGRSAAIRYIITYPEIKFKVLFVPFKYGKDIKDVVNKYDIKDIKQIINNKIK